VQLTSFAVNDILNARNILFCSSFFIESIILKRIQSRAGRSAVDVDTDKRSKSDSLCEIAREWRREMISDRSEPMPLLAEPFKVPAAVVVPANSAATDYGFSNRTRVSRYYFCCKANRDKMCD